MKDKIWLYKFFYMNSIPNWKCPTCKYGYLSIDGSFMIKPTHEYQRKLEPSFDEYGQEMPSVEGQIEGHNGRFIGFLKCNSKTCNEFVTVTGNINDVWESFEDPNYGWGTGDETTSLYYPRYFDPPIGYIEISSSYPIEIQNELEKCFTLYWIDNSACANRIRTVVELLLDDQKIPRKKLEKKKGINKFQPLSLHKRLEKFQEKKSEIADFLLSIKWIGNEGSHNNSLTNNQVINAFDLLDHALKKIYIKEDDRLKKISKKINKTKKPI